jgi:16S rRNA (cytosine967-C5)-methyltransferase
MTPGARVEEAIVLLDRIAAPDATEPGDAILAGHFRRHRYIGAKDRRAIADLVYAVLRHCAALDWWVEREAGRPPSARSRVLAALALIEALPPGEIVARFDGSRYGPAPLDPAEQRLIAALAGSPLDHQDQPPAVRGNYPDWLEPALVESFGGRLAEEMAAMNRPAAVDLRVNTLKATRAEAAAALAAAGVEAAPTALSPLGLRLAGRGTLPALAPFRDGLVEVQDEGSQLIALLLDARPGQQVVDYCAGAGGKTLALAASMADRGRLVAGDVSSWRLRGLAPRLARAGATIVESCAGAALDALPDGAFDRVLVDAPCSGTGTWRRNPEARWRLTPAALEEYQARQRAILSAASRLVKPGGRLLYATCSILAVENDRQMEWFLERHDDFAALPVGVVWPAAVGGAAPAEAVGAAGPWLHLTPAVHGTDGFFAALVERRAGASGDR